MKKKKVIITVAIVAIAAIIAIISWPKKSVPVEFEMTDVQPDTIRNRNHRTCNGGRSRYTGLRHHQQHICGL